MIEDYFFNLIHCYTEQGYCYIEFKPVWLVLFYLIIAVVGIGLMLELIAFIIRRIKLCAS